jgi:hypothetical protein
MWIEIFKSGHHKDSLGKKHSFSEEDLQKIARDYNNKVGADPSHLAPLVKGHPRGDDPAYGWIEKLTIRGSRLLAKLKDIAPELIKEVRRGMFRKVSLALYPNRMLRHVGVLGAVPPAVKGLKSLAFSSDESYEEFEKEEAEMLRMDELVEFGEKILDETDVLKSQNEELLATIESMEFSRRKNDYLEFIEEEKDGILANLTPHQQKCLLEILILSDSKNTSEKENLSEKIINFLQDLQNITNLHEKNISFSEANIVGFEDKNVDPEKMMLHENAIKMMNENPTLSYEEAVLDCLR